MYNVLESRIVFENNQIQSITVLVEVSPNDIRAFQAKQTVKAGYFNISPKTELNAELLQIVSGYGDTVDVLTNFPDAKKYFKKSKS